MRRWHIPSRTGDFELTVHPKDPEKSLLVTEDLTPDEAVKVREFLRACRDGRRKWVDDLVGVTSAGRCEIVIEATVEKAGALFVVNSTTPRGRLTAIRSKAGEITEVVAHDDAGKDAEAEALAAAAASKEADKAVTVKPPTRCCPMPIEGPLVRSSKVLKSFCTEEQWNDWMNKGYLHCYGSHSGHKYRIVHRHHPLAAVQQKIVYDLDENRYMKCWDWSVPPAEEVLAMKLYLEHREPMIRNRSTALGYDPLRHTDLSGCSGVIGSSLDSEDVYEDYFGGSDGTWDAGQLGSFGAFIARFAGDESALLSDPYMINSFLTSVLGVHGPAREEGGLGYDSVDGTLLDESGNVIGYGYGGGSAWADWKQAVGADEWSANAQLGIM